MSTETQLMDMLKDAMRAKDSRTADCIRMIKTKHMERRTAAGFKGPLDDALWMDVIASYAKQMKKSREEYAALGDKGKAHIAELDFELEFCAKFLPKAASDDEVRAAVIAAIATTGIKDPKQSGKLMGEVMKANKGKFDPAATKRIVEEELAKG